MKIVYWLDGIVGAVESSPEPQPHPQAPENVVPKPVTDFKRYRANAQQHGPLARAGHFPSRQQSNGDPEVFLDRNELPARFRRMVLSAKEIEAIDVCPLIESLLIIQSGGATLIW